MAFVYSKTEYKSPVQWVTTDKSGKPPPKAVVGGKDHGGETLYVGRGVVQNDCIPGKIHYKYGFCFVPYHHKEHSLTEYQVLTNPYDAQLEWVSASGGQVPNGAIQGGLQSDGAMLYIGRAEYKDNMHIGKVHPGHGTLYVSYAGEEHKIGDYEVLVIKEIKH